MSHLWSLYQEALADYSIREEALRPPDDDDPHTVTPISPPPAHLRHLGSGAPLSHPPHEDDGPIPGLHAPPPLPSINATKPLATGTPPIPDGTGTPYPRPPYATRDFWDSRLGEDHG